MTALSAELKELDRVEGKLRSEPLPHGELKEKEGVSAVVAVSDLVTTTIKESGRVSAQLVEC